MKKRRYSLHLDAELLAQLKDLAAVNTLSVSENIRRAIKARLIANGHLISHRGDLQRVVKDIRRAPTLDDAMNVARLVLRGPGKS
jgi:hypothetical protein